jgi:GT2 family glycosyltransferase
VSTSIECSVITVNFNNAQGLARTLRSVDQQTHTSLESIVIDGASSDASTEVMRVRSSSKRTIHLSEPDAGIYDAMNKGLGLASGDLVVFMNSGDCFSGADVVARAASDWRARGWRWAYGLGRVLTEGGEPVAILHRVPHRPMQVALGNETVPHQAVFMERSLIHELGGFDLSVGLAADQDLLVRAARRSPPVSWPEFIVDFEGGGAGSTRRYWEFPLEMRLARRRRNQPLGGSWLADWGLTASVLLRRGLLDAQARVRRRLR